MINAIQSSANATLAAALLVTVFLTLYAYQRYANSPQKQTDTNDTPDGLSEDLVEALETAADNELDSHDDREKLPKELAVLFLLEAADDQTIEGKTRMQKLIFLLQEEWDEYSDDPYPFEKYEFEPHNY